MRRTRLIFELCFIFLLPLLFLLPHFKFNVVNENIVRDSNSDIVSYDKSYQLEILTNDDLFDNDNVLTVAVNDLGDLLGLDVSNAIINIVLNYLVLWFLQFCIWHTVYRVFDYIVHLTDKTWLKD